MLLVGVIFVLIIVLVIWQLKGLGIGWSVMFGVVLVLVMGVVYLGDILVVWNIVWNVMVVFIVVIIISLLLDEFGFFEWVVLYVLCWGNGCGCLLFIWIVLFGVVVVVLFVNDGVVFILILIVIVMLLVLGLLERLVL